MTEPNVSEDYVPCSRTVYVVGPVPYFVCGQAPASPIHKVGPSGTHRYQPDLVTALERSLAPRDICREQGCQCGRGAHTAQENDA